MDKIPVSILIMTKNEEMNVRQCLESVKWADEIFIVDSQSTDKTLEIAGEYTDKIIQFEWNGKFPKKKNWALMNMPFSHEWVLMLDADEFAPPGLRDEINGILGKNVVQAGFIARFNYIFMGKPIKHGDPVRKLVFLKHKLTRFEQLDDSGLDYRVEVEVHEHPIVDGPTGVLKSRIVHNDRRDLSYYFDRHNRYSTWEAFLLHKDRYTDASSVAVKPKAGGNWLNVRRFLKYVFLRLPCKPLIYFIYGYIFRLGFMDGYPGFVYNACKAFYAFQIGVKVREFKTREKGDVKI